VLTDHADTGSGVLVVEDLGQQRLPARTMVAVLRQAGFRADLAHFGADTDKRTFVDLTLSRQPNLIVLSTLFGHMLGEHLVLAGQLRARGAAAHLTLAGPLPALDAARLLQACPALDSVLLGEAEAVLPKLAHYLDQHIDWAVTPGVAYRAEQVRANPLPPPFNLDNLPYPVREDGIARFQGMGYATVVASRGCYHACAFCVPSAYHRSISGGGYRLRSVAGLVDEMEQLYARGTRLFLFDDEQFLPPRRARAGRVQALGDALRQHHMRVAFTLKCRTDDVEEDLFVRLRNLGLIRVYLGLESGCQATLDCLNKRTTVNQNAAALELLDKLGIVADFICLMFNPWSTLETVGEEIEFLTRVLTLVPTAVTFNEVMCFAGTPLSSTLSEDSSRTGARDIGGERYQVSGDPRVEMLRHAARCVFAPHYAADGIVADITRTWYEILLARRFTPSTYQSGRAEALRSHVRQLNSTSLNVWRAMLELASHTEPDNATAVGAHTGEWSTIIRGQMLATAEALDPG
jgi:anaerobic magnesium-protoporphyrin IX monomethyl ester cyclase